MSTTSVYCLAPSRGAADLILHDLRLGKVSPALVSVLFLDQRVPTAVASAGAPPAAPSSTEIRGVVAWVPGIRLLPAGSPGDSGALVVGGPINAAFATGDTSSLAARLFAFGLPEAEARRYADKINQGATLLAVQGRDRTALAWVHDLFVAASATDIFTFTEVTSARRATLSERSRSEQDPGSGNIDPGAGRSIATAL